VEAGEKVMLELLLTSLLVSLSAVALTVILRNAPIIRTWVFEVRKPWACNVCMPLYTCAAVVGLLAYLHRDLHVLLAYLPAYALTNVALDRMAQPPGPPHIPAEMFDAEDEVSETHSVPPDAH
jgi:hypothetical protein